jgi:hypothetical protein
LRQCLGSLCSPYTSPLTDLAMIADFVQMVKFLKMDE